ncbi:uncharacterized protein [Oscarella lobularis]|uniref:uncharacterized protein n=1 Tax=Oscarella lobularis TaxID=121494 RepID=UPI0033134782
MSVPDIHRDRNNYYHPESEADIITLVNYARANAYQVRVRGSGHSMPQATFTDPCVIDEVDVSAAAPEANVNMVLDRYNEILSLDVTTKRVTVQSGIHLGRDPENPTSTLENSLLHQLHVEGLALESLGGISHQTVAGFLCTGSAGGSLTFNAQDNVQALRFVDGKGEIVEVSRSDDNLDDFNASLVSLGLLGVISTVTFECVHDFNICGSQIGTLTDDSSVDLFSDCPEEPRIGVTNFLKAAEYARIIWWPQGESRTQIWQAKQISPTSDFEPIPFAVFPNPEIMMLYSYLMTVLGNIQDMAEVRSIGESKEQRFKMVMTEYLTKEYELPNWKAEGIANLLNKGNDIVLKIVTGLIDTVCPIKRALFLPLVTNTAIALLNEVGKEEKFQDYGYAGLPMDNSSDDVIVPVMWSEMWIPLSQATKATSALRDYFSKIIGDGTVLKKTGNNCIELYATKSSNAWLSMSYSSGDDEWSEGAFRVDPYWFVHNKGDFRELFGPM